MAGEVDWSKLGITGSILNAETMQVRSSRGGNSKLDNIARRAAARAAGAHTPWEDAYMDCLLYLAEHPEFADRLLTMSGSKAAHYLYTYTAYQGWRASTDMSARGNLRDQVETGASRVQRGATNYTEDEVAEMLVIHYVPSMVDGYTDATEDSDMPRSAANPAHKHTSWARLADLNGAMKRAELTKREEQCAFLYHVMGMSSTEAAKILKVSHPTVRTDAARAITKITEAINRKDH